MSTTTFPHTMTKGMFKDQTFQTWQEYAFALDRAHGNGTPKRGDAGKKRKKAAPVGSYRVDVRVGGMHMVVEGTIDKGTDVVSTLLDALSQLPMA